LLHWKNTFEEMQRNGVEVPVPEEHSELPSAKRGELVGLRLGISERWKVPALFGKVKFLPEHVKLAASTNCSIYVPTEAFDGKQNRYVRPIRHVALTDYPVIPGLGKFQAIAASFIGDLKMSMQSLAEKLGVPVAGKEDPQLEMEILSAVQVLKTELETMRSKIADLEKGATGGEGEGEGEGGTPVPEPEVAASMVQMLNDNRKMKIEKLQLSGRITPVVAKQLIDEHCTDGALRLSMKTKNPDTSFDKIIAALSANEPVLSFKEQTGAQGVALSNASTKAEENPLIADAEARSAK